MLVHCELSYETFVYRFFRLTSIIVLLMHLNLEYPTNRNFPLKFNKIHNT